MAEMDPVEQAARLPDVYVFFTATRGMVDKFAPAGNPAFRFLADLQGWRWTAMAIVEPLDLFELSVVAGRVMTSPDDPVDETAKPVTYGTEVLRHTKHFPHFAFARLRVEEGRALEVLEAVNAADGYAGSALVSGKFHILVEIGGDTPEELQANLGALGSGIGGITDKEVGLLAGEHYFYKPLGFFTIGETEPEQEPS